MNASPVAISQTLARQRWLVRGQVQGVGFRPFVFRLARQLGLSGFVLNQPDGVLIEAQGPGDRLAELATSLQSQAPPLAKIRHLAATDLPVRDAEHQFIIADSHLGDDRVASRTDVTVDTAVCDSCVKEILSPSDRRRAHGLINCTQCGPRFSITQKIPYDRASTTMSTFVMCAKCRAEYVDPSNRRFHAQPIACHDCGPKVSIAKPDGAAVQGDPYIQAAQALMEGKIVAIKGLGGFHLAVRADDPAAVRRLRERKRRDAKPFALMCCDLGEAQSLVKLGALAEAILASPVAPIVLASRKRSAHVAAEVAPRTHRLGVMLPNTPIQHLVFHADPKLRTLVMTSANASDEPLVIDNDEAVQRIGGMCDLFLWHQRPIARGVDDSIVIDMGDDSPIPIRRARGFVPESIELPVKAQVPGVALGAELKSTIAVVRDGAATLSQHLGDLTHPRTYHLFRQTITDLTGLLDAKPKWVAHDLHPTYLSTVQAQQIAKTLNVPAIGVQHHHAHAAAVMAEHGISSAVLAVVCDGTGYGTDGSSWGGELLLADLTGYRRVARLRPLKLPGGDASAKDTRRCALALLHQALGSGFASHPMVKRLVPTDGEREMLTGAIQKSVGCAISSGAGRYFDAIAALLGLSTENQFEAQSAMALESSADGATPHVTSDPAFHFHPGKPAELDFAPLVHELLAAQKRGVPIESLAAMFHEQFALAWESVVARASEKTGLKRVALSGGVFCNAILTRRLTALLQARGLDVLRHRVVPPNDGGLALGQAAIATARLAKGLVNKGGA